MKLINFNVYVVLAFLILSCKNDKRHDFKNVIKSDFKIFLGINIEARKEKKGTYYAPYFIKKDKERDYILPNFSYFNCNLGDYECLNNNTRQKFDIEQFSVEYSNNDENFAINYIEKIVSEYEKIKVFKVLSDPKIGECIIFFYDEQKYLAYVPDTSKVYNPIWKKEFFKSSVIDSNWYSNWY